MAAASAGTSYCCSSCQPGRVDIMTGSRRITSKHHARTTPTIRGFSSPRRRQGSHRPLASRSCVSARLRVTFSRVVLLRGAMPLKANQPCR